MELTLLTAESRSGGMPRRGPGWTRAARRQGARARRDRPRWRPG
jgi:hypothetical protein